MSWPERQQRAQAAVFDTLGRDAQWEGVDDTVRVKLNASEQVVGLSVEDAIELRVRLNEVADPRKGQLVQIAGKGTFSIIGTPMLDRNDTWRCEAKPV